MTKVLAAVDLDQLAKRLTPQARLVEGRLRDNQLLDRLSRGL